MFGKVDRKTEERIKKAIFKIVENEKQRDQKITVILDALEKASRDVHREILDSEIKRLEAIINNQRGGLCDGKVRYDAGISASAEEEGDQDS